MRYVARTYGDMPSSSRPLMSSGAASTAQMENWARDCRSVTASVPSAAWLRRRHGSFHPPGAANLASGAMMSMFLRTPAQLLSSGPMRHELPSDAPTGAYHSFHPQSEHSSSEHLSGEDWLDFDSVQVHHDPENVAAKALGDGRSRRPKLVVETNYFGS